MLKYLKEIGRYFILMKKVFSFPEKKDIFFKQLFNEFEKVGLSSLSIVLIISFVAVIIILDTFKSSLSNYFPNLELILYNLFETLRDLILFAKDLN